MNTANVNISLSFDQIINILSQLPLVEKRKISQYLARETSNESKILKDIEEGLKEVKLHSEGKIKLKTLDQLLDEL
jgi:hypothetical protein